MFLANVIKPVWYLMVKWQVHIVDLTPHEWAPEFNHATEPLKFASCLPYHITVYSSTALCPLMYGVELCVHMHVMLEGEL